MEWYPHTHYSHYSELPFPMLCKSTPCWVDWPSWFSVYFVWIDWGGGISTWKLTFSNSNEPLGWWSDFGKGICLTRRTFSASAPVLIPASQDCWLNRSPWQMSLSWLRPTRSVKLKSLVGAVQGTTHCDSNNKSEKTKKSKKDFIRIFISIS